MMMVKDNPNISHWSLERGYNYDSSENEYPHKFINSLLYPFSIELVTSEEDCEYLCIPFSEGYILLLNVPGETIKTARYSMIPIPLAETTRIFIEPRITTTSEGLRSYSPEQRQCFYNDERRLRFFKKYTQHSCEAECLANFTKAKCGCVRFDMPRDKDTKICGVKSISCYIDAENRFTVNNIVFKSIREQCNCKPGCTSIDYHAEIDHSKYDLDGLRKSANVTQSARHNILLLDFHNQMKSLERVEIYTLADFMAICGGLLGLFLGISALSVIEFIYYFTLRLYWTIRRSRSGNTILPFVRVIAPAAEPVRSRQSRRNLEELEHPRILPV